MRWKDARPPFSPERYACPLACHTFDGGPGDSQASWASLLGSGVGGKRAELPAVVCCMRRARNLASRLLEQHSLPGTRTNRGSKSEIVCQRPFLLELRGCDESEVVAVVRRRARRASQPPRCARFGESGAPSLGGAFGLSPWCVRACVVVLAKNVVSCVLVVWRGHICFARMQCMRLLVNCHGFRSGMSLRAATLEMVSVWRTAVRSNVHRDRYGALLRLFQYAVRAARLFSRQQGL